MSDGTETTRRIITQAELDEVLSAHPTLTAYGMAAAAQQRRLVGSRSEPSGMPPLLEDVQLSADWLADKPRVARYRSGFPSHIFPDSYYAKHVMQRENDNYVTNGAFIAAAYLLGIEVRPGCPNAAIGVKIRNEWAKPNGSKP
jgi:hypothetical protein